MARLAASRRIPLPLKAVVVLSAMAGLGFLFARSLGDTRGEPYALRPEHLSGWTLVRDEAATGDRPLVLLAPPAELPMRLFRQVFTRAGESLTAPAAPGIGLVLADELRSGPVPTEELMGVAREAGVDRARIVPRCMAYRRESQPGSTRQIYFVVFDMPEFAAFRRAVAARVATTGGTGFEPAALSPIMTVAAAPDFSRWMPIVAKPEADCGAPFVSER